MGKAPPQGEEPGAGEKVTPWNPSAMDSPVEIPLTDCVEVATRKSAASSPSMASFEENLALAMPAGRSILDVQASWADKALNRKLSVGLGACPPCTSLAEKKGVGGSRLQISKAQIPSKSKPFEEDQEWFVRVQVDPKSDDLTRLGYELKVQACNVDEARATGLAGKAVLFPIENLVPSTVRRIEKSAFGVEGLDDVRVASYASKGELFTAFVAVRDSESTASKATEAYEALVLASGGKEIPFPGLPGAKAFEFGGTISVIFQSGSIAAGVVEAQPGPEIERFIPEFHRWLSNREGR